MTQPPGGSIRLGDHTIGRIGYGAMQLEHADAASARAVLRRAVELGVDHIDTAAFYGEGTSNRFIREALHPSGDDPVVVTKVGVKWAGPQNPHAAAQRPAELREQVLVNLDQLGMERLPVVNLRRMPPTPGVDAVPLEDQVAEMISLRDDGLIGGIGLSNVTLDEVRRALPAGIACVQNRYSLLERHDEDILGLCEGNGIVWVPYFPLGSAFHRSASPLGHPVVRDIAARHGVGPASVCLAWILAHSPVTALIPGTVSVAHLEENVAVGSLHLGADEIASLEALAEWSASTAEINSPPRQM